MATNPASVWKFEEWVQGPCNQRIGEVLKVSKNQRQSNILGQASGPKKENCHIFQISVLNTSLESSNLPFVACNLSCIGRRIDHSGNSLYLHREQASIEVSERQLLIEETFK